MRIPLTSALECDPPLAETILADAPMNVERRILPGIREVAS